MAQMEMDTDNPTLPWPPKGTAAMADPVHPFVLPSLSQVAKPSYSVACLSNFPSMSLHVSACLCMSHLAFQCFFIYISRAPDDLKLIHCLKMLKDGSEPWSKSLWWLIHVSFHVVIWLHTLAALAGPRRLRQLSFRSSGDCMGPNQPSRPCSNQQVLSPLMRMVIQIANKSSGFMTP